MIKLPSFTTRLHIFFTLCRYSKPLLHYLTLYLVRILPIVNARYKTMCLNRLTVSSVRQHYFSTLHCLKFGVIVTPHNLQLILCAITTTLTEMMSVRKSVRKCTHSQCMRRVHTFNMCIVSRARLSAGRETGQIPILILFLTRQKTSWRVN